MERRDESAEWEVPPFLQRLEDEAKRRGKLKAKIELVLRFSARLGIALSEADRARVLACTDIATLDRWLDNVLSAKSSAELLT